MVWGIIKSAFIVTAVFFTLGALIVLGVCYFQERAAKRRRLARDEYRRKHLEFLRKYNAKL